MEQFLKKQAEILSQLDDSVSRQNDVLKSLDKTNKDIAKIVGSIHSSDRATKENSLEKELSKLNLKTGDNLNSNVIKLFKEVKRQTDMVSRNYQNGANKELSGAQAQKISGDVTGRRQYRTIQPRVDDFKGNVKDFFSMRGFLDKTGIVKRKSGGLVSEYLDRAEDKKKYVESRMKLDPTAKLHGSAKAKEIFAKQFDKQQSVERDIRKNESALKGYKEQGFTEAQIARTPEGKRQKDLAVEMAKVDTRVRPEGFDAKTGLMKESEDAKKVSGKKASKELAAITGDGSSDEENMLEQNKMLQEQTVLLTQIEKNTSSADKDLKEIKNKPTSGGGGSDSGGSDSSGFGIMDMLGSAKSKVAGVAGSVGKGLLGAGKAVGGSLLRNAGPLAAVAAVAGGAYTGYNMYKEANDRQDQQDGDIANALKSGEITQEQADKLKQSNKDNALVEKSGAVGSGAGQAAGGVAGALHGAAMGAALGSIVPGLGTVVGGAIGAGVGGLAGSYLGQKAGNFIGETGGRAYNAAGDLYNKAKTGVPEWYEDKKKSAMGLWESAKSTGASLWGDAKEYGQRGINAVSDTAYNLKENTLDNVESYTGAGKAYAKAKASVRSMFGLQSGSKSEDLGEGRTKRTNEDGSYSTSDSEGTKNYDASGKLISEQGPTFMGVTNKKNYANDTVEQSYDMGQMRAKMVSNADGSVQSTAKYELGAGVFTKRETLTARQVAELKAAEDVSAASSENEMIKLNGGKSGGNTTVVAPTTVNNNKQNITQIKAPIRNQESSQRYVPSWGGTNHRFGMYE